MSDENHSLESTVPAVPAWVRGVLMVALVLILSAAAGALGWWLARSNDSAVEGSGGLEGETFLLPVLDGGESGPAAHPGEVVVVDFWATWCGPCVAQARILEMVHEEVGEHVKFFAVDVAEEEQTVRDFLANRPFPYPVLMDTDGAVAERAGIYGFPTVVVFGRSGEIVYRRSGISSKRELLDAISNELGLEPNGELVSGAP